jgi:hypothetical protein
MDFPCICLESNKVVFDLAKYFEIITLQVKYERERRKKINEKSLMKKSRIISKQEYLVFELNSLIGKKGVRILWEPK